MIKNIPPKIYRNILTLMPIPCVDVVIRHKQKFLLGKRTHEPAKGKWWLIGGRVFKNELLRQAAKRKLREETGLTAGKMKLITTYELNRLKNAWGGKAHTISTVFFVTVASTDVVKESQHQELKWFSHIDPSWDPEVKTVLRTANFK